MLEVDQATMDFHRRDELKALVLGQYAALLAYISLCALSGRPQELSPALIEENIDVDRFCSSDWESVLSLVIETVSVCRKEALCRSFSCLSLKTIFTWASSEMLRKLGNPKGMI